MRFWGFIESIWLGRRDPIGLRSRIRSWSWATWNDEGSLKKEENRREEIDGGSAIRINEASRGTRQAVVSLYLLPSALSIPVHPFLDFLCYSKRKERRGNSEGGHDGMVFRADDPAAIGGVTIFLGLLLSFPPPPPPLISRWFKNFT